MTFTTALGWRAACAALAVGLAASACGSPTTPSTTTTDTSTTTTATAAAFTLAIGGQTTLTGLRQRSQLTATITLDDGTTQDVTKATRWTSTNTAVAVVTTSGVVTTITPGTTGLIGTYQSGTDSFVLLVSPVTTTFRGTLQGSDGRNGTFVLVVNGSVAPTSTTTTADVSGVFQIPGDTISVTGIFEATTGAVTFSGVGIAYRFSGTVANGVVTGLFTAFGEVTGVFSSVTTTQS